MDIMNKIKKNLKSLDEFIKNRNKIYNYEFN